MKRFARVAHFDDLLYLLHRCGSQPPESNRVYWADLEDSQGRRFPPPRDSHPVLFTAKRSPRRAAIASIRCHRTRKLRAGHPCHRRSPNEPDLVTSPKSLDTLSLDRSAWVEASSGIHLKEARQECLEAARF